MSAALPLAGKRGLVTGIANADSIAWGCAKAFRAMGAGLAGTYQNDKAPPHREPQARPGDPPRGSPDRGGFLTLIPKITKVFYIKV